MIIGIIGYFTVPSVANYILHAGGGNILLYKVSNVFSSTASSTMNTVSSGAGMIADSMGGSANKMSGSMSSSGISNGYFKEKLSGK
jgi:hypothetical protein